MSACESPSASPVLAVRREAGQPVSDSTTLWGQDPDVYQTVPGLVKHDDHRVGRPARQRDESALA